MKVFAYMKNDTYRDLCPDYPYEVAYRIGWQYIALVERGNARYRVPDFILKDENGAIVKKTFMPELIPTMHEVRRRNR